ncbi:bone morphogenetic protein 2-like isoform X1 [Centrocercus urophasianus]|uniref:bone morphogenetic protein 2-like isoform X1 n=1 Tax=Centrocercus urophasianus TaxID=9002 RepID=UPI001C646AC0|nr:bone morphogenetic protein 2-like isoform X1 [Centrocercus urophasianus]
MLTFSPPGPGRAERVINAAPGLQRGAKPGQQSHAGRRAAAAGLGTAGIHGKPQGRGSQKAAGSFWHGGPPAPPGPRQTAAAVHGGSVQRGGQRRRRHQKPRRPGGEHAQGEKMRFLFVLSSVAKNEKILTAELHLFRLWPRAAEGPRRHHFCQVSVYQILDKAEPDSPKGQKLLASRLLSLQGSGWEVFAITQAVRDWTQDESSNRGLLVTVHSLGGSTLEAPAVQFASSGDHHESKKPMLVLFTDDGRRGASLPMAGVPASQPRDFPAKLTGPRSARSLDRLQPCQRHPLSVDFEEIGWSGWIISPRGYNAYHCRGSCPFPLGENMRPTNHATVQSIINALKLSEGVSSPCCVPDKLYSINLLYFDDDENVVLKQYDDMVAGSCGCH